VEQIFVYELKQRQYVVPRTVPLVKEILKNIEELVLFAFGVHPVTNVYDLLLVLELQTECQGKHFSRISSIPS
jgi:hypothetical protein